MQKEVVITDSRFHKDRLTDHVAIIQENHVAAAASGVINYPLHTLCVVGESCRGVGDKGYQVPDLEFEWMAAIFFTFLGGAGLYGGL